HDHAGGDQPRPHRPDLRSLAHALRGRGRESPARGNPARAHPPRRQRPHRRARRPRRPRPRARALEGLRPEAGRLRPLHTPPPLHRGRSGRSLPGPRRHRGGPARDPRPLPGTPPHPEGDRGSRANASGPAPPPAAGLPRLPRPDLGRAAGAHRLRRPAGGDDRARRALPDAAREHRTSDHRELRHQRAGRDRSAADRCRRTCRPRGPGQDASNSPLLGRQGRRAHRRRPLSLIACDSERDWRRGGLRGILGLTPGRAAAGSRPARSGGWMRRIAAPWLALVCTACGASSLERPGEVLLDPVAIILSEEVVDFTAIGATRRLSAVAVAADGHPIFGAPIAWSSTDPTVASVDSHGLVTALSQGRADIVASYGGVASRALVRVSPVPRDLAKLAILPSAPLLTYLGQTLELRAVALDRNDNVLGEVLATWEVEDAQVATVDRMGILVAMAPGATRVRATVVDRSLSTETTITVRPLPSTLIFLSLPVDVEAGQPRSVRIEARDAGGRLVGTPDLTVELWAEYADGFSIHIGQRVLDLGIATFEEVVFQRSGEVRLVARHGSVEAKSASFLVVPGPASGLRFLDPPERVEARTPFELRVAITDEFGNPVPSTKAVIHLSLREANPSGLELGGETSREIIDGVATFSDLVLDAAGDVVVEAASFPWEAAEIPLRARYVFSRLSAGSDHTCGVLSSGETLCFGANAGGPLGLPSDDAQAAPVPVLGLPLLRELEAAFRYSCGISFEDEVICWGEVPGFVPPPAGPVVLALPAAAPRSLGLGADHLCVAFDDGQVHCLGDNTFGQL